MGRKKVEINPIRGKRLRELLEESGMEQQELAKKIGYTPEHISYICKGKRNLTSSAAEKIVKIFPSVSFDWLMGVSDYRTTTEKSLADFADWNSEWKRRLWAVRVLAFLAGYDIELFDKNTENGKEDVIYALEQLKQGYKIMKDGKVVATCPVERFNLLATECQELVEHRIKSYVREVSKDG